MESFYRKIGKRIREDFRDCGYAVITPGVEYEKILSVPYNRKIVFKNGGIRIAVIIKDL